MRPHTAEACSAPACLSLPQVYFPNIYDIKYLMKFCDSLHGGLNRLAETLEVERIGPQHQVHALLGYCVGCGWVGGWVGSWSACARGWLARRPAARGRSASARHDRRPRAARTTRWRQLLFFCAPAGGRAGTHCLL
jgi:hypothetical protein